MRFIYEYLYYKIYSFLKLFPKNDIIEWSALLGVSLFVMLNINTIADIITLKLQKHIEYNRIQGYVLAIVVLIANYFIFIHKKRYKKILKEYPQRDSDLGTILVIIYVIISVWCLFHFGKKIRIMNGVE